MNMFYFPLILTIFSFISPINIHSKGRYVSIKCDNLTYFDRNKENDGGGGRELWQNDYINKKIDYFSKNNTYPPYYKFIKECIYDIIQKCLSNVTIEDKDKKLTEKSYDSNKVLKAFKAEFKKIPLPIKDICSVKYEDINDNGRFVFSLAINDNISTKDLGKCFDFKVYYLAKNGEELNNEQKAAYIKYINYQGYKNNISAQKNAKSFTSETTLKDYFFKGFFSAVDDEGTKLKMRCRIYTGISFNYAYNEDIASEIAKTEVKVELDNVSKKIVVYLIYHLKNNVYNHKVYVRDGCPLFKNDGKEFFSPNYDEYYVDDVEYITDDINSKRWEGIQQIACITTPNRKKVEIYSKYRKFSKEDELDYKNIINNHNNAKEIKINGTYPKYDDFLNNKIDSKEEQEMVNKYVKVILDYVNKQDLVKIRFFNNKFKRLDTMIYDNCAVYLEYYVKAYCSKYISEKIKNMSIGRDILLDIMFVKKNGVKEDELFKNTKINSLIEFLKEVENEVKSSNKLLSDNWNTIISVIATKERLLNLPKIQVINDSKYIYELLLEIIKEQLVHFYIKFEEAPEGKKLKQQYNKLLSKQPFSVLLPVENTFKDEMFVKYLNKMLGEDCLDVKNICKIYKDIFLKTPVDKPLIGQTYILKFNDDQYEDINKNNSTTPANNKPKIEQKPEMKPIPKPAKIELNNHTKGTTKLDNKGIKKTNFATPNTNGTISTTNLNTKVDILAKVIKNTTDIKGTTDLDSERIILNKVIKNTPDIKGTTKLDTVETTKIKGITSDTPRPLYVVSKKEIITETPGESSSDIKKTEIREKTEVIKEIKDTKKPKTEGSKDGGGTKKTGDVEGSKDKTRNIPNNINDKKSSCCNKCCCKCCQTR